MTAADNTNLGPREAENSATSRLFAFYRVRAGASQRFYPGRGTRLHFASKATDTLEVAGVPSGLLAAGDKVRVQYKGATVFLGKVESWSKRQSRGTDEVEDVVCSGPWADMQRLVYRQLWMTGSSFQYSSRLILNQYQDGTAQNLNSELAEIAGHGASACGYTVATPVSVSTQFLPFDECRDITVADAIRRELRYFPKTIVRFDYSGATPQLVFAHPGSGSDAAYVATVPKTSRQYDYTAHPIAGVDLEIETVADDYRVISHQTAGNTSAGNPDCLYATLQLAGATGSTVTQSLNVVTESVPGDLNDKTWWKSKHPRLANVAANEITITNGARSGAATASDYPRIVSNSAGELEAAGIQCRVEQFTCDVSINHATDAEENIKLTMNFLTTNATTKKYTWVVSSDSTSGETVPDGLAAAILADRSGELRREKLVLRLGDALPTLGDRCDGLFLQTFDVDCCTLIAELTFGAPEYLSPEDMAGLLSGFRNKRRSTTSTSRSTGKPKDDAKDKVESGSIPPLSSTEWAPGNKTKFTVHPPAANNNAGTIKLDSTSVPRGKTLETHTLTITGTGSGGSNTTVKILATEDLTITPGGGSSTSGANGTIYSFEGLYWDSSSYMIRAKFRPCTVTNGLITAIGEEATTADAKSISTTPITSEVPY